MHVQPQRSMANTQTAALTTQVVLPILLKQSASNDASCWPFMVVLIGMHLRLIHILYTTKYSASCWSTAASYGQWCEHLRQIVLVQMPMARIARHLSRLKAMARGGDAHQAPGNVSASTDQHVPVLQ